MEERILHSADAAPLTGMDAAGAVALHRSTQQPTAADSSQRSEIAFVDMALPDAGGLLADLQVQRDAGRPIQIVRIAAEEDGLARIGAALAGRHDIAAVHVLAHGSDGMLRLGAAQLDASSLLARAGEIAGWGDSLTSDADLLLYGCDLAQSALGQGLVRDLAALTGADVAASTDLTGAASLGGNWVLEYRTGDIGAVLAVGLAQQAQWQGVMATYTVTLGGDLGALNALVPGTLRWAISQANANAGTDTIVFTASSATLGGLFAGDDTNANGDLDITESLNIVGNGSGVTTITGGGVDRVFDIRAGTVNISGVTVQGGRSDTGGGLRVNSAASLTLTDVVVQNNTGSGNGEGGGIYTQGALTLRNVVVKENGNQSAGNTEGAGIYVASGGTLDALNVEVRDNDSDNKDGGGIYIRSGGSATLVNTTIAGNVGKRGAGLYVAATGISLFNATLSGNSASSEGGGLWSDNGVTLNHVTVAGNAASTGGGVFSKDNGSVAAGNSIFAGNTGGNTNGKQTSQGYNLSDDGSSGFGATGDRTNTAAGLSALAANGGFARTHAIGASSAARDAANPAPSGGTDQRGTAYFNGRADIGSYEFNTGLPPTISAVANQTLSEDGALAATAFVVGDPESGTTGLVVTAASSNQALIPDANLVLGGSGGNRTISLAPLANRNSSANGGPVTITLTVSDGGSTTSTTFTVTVLAVNDAPSGASRTVTTREDTVYTFALADFGFTDANDGSAHALSSVKVGTLPVLGLLTLSGAAVAAGQSVSAANIAAGNLKFTPAAHASGTGYASFTFQVQDDGGTANGGVDMDPVARTMTLDVTAVNDAPSGADRTVSTLEDTAYVFTLADFGFGDGNDAPANALRNVRLAALPAAGNLTLSGAAVTAGQFVSAASITAGNLRFTPAANASGTAYASFTFQVQDDGGTANGGVDLDPVARTMTIDVSAVNDAPSGADRTVTTLENTAYVFTLADFGFSDANDAPAHALTHLRLASLPASGSLTLSGGAVTAGQFVSAADIAAGNLRFAPVANASGTGYASFAFQVQDDGGTANGGADLDPVARTMTIDVLIVNDAPSGADRTVSTLEDTVYVFTLADFGFSDAADTPANALASVRIASLPAAGSLRLDGNAVVATQFVSAADIAAGQLRFTPLAGTSGTGYASFTFQVRDDGGTANGGVDLDPVARTLAIDVTAVNDAPAGADRTVTTLEDTAYVFTLADFGFSDAADTPAHQFAHVRIATLASAGNLTLSGGAVTAGQFVSAADIAAGNLRFAPVANASGAGYASFSFQVQDDGGTANGGVDLDPVARTMAIDVLAVNDAPAGADRAVSTLEDTVYVFTLADFGFSDAADSPADTLVSVRIDTLTAAGVLSLNGSAVLASQSISRADIAAARLVFTPVPDANAAGYAAFTFRVRDDGGTANGGLDMDTLARTLTVNVTAVNDAPMNSVPGAQNIATGDPLVFSVAGANAIQLADPDAGSQSLQVTLGVTHGVLTLNGTSGLALLLGTGSGDATVRFTGSLADINTALDGLRFDPDALFSGSIVLTVETSDLGHTGAGGVLVDSDSIVINVSFVNSAPVLSGANNLAPTREDFAADTGTAVEDLLAGQVTDLNAGSLQGIAVTAVDNSQGVWQYSLNGGIGWTAFGSPSDGSARLLAADSNTFVRFQANAGWSGTVANGISFRAWDLTSGAAGGTSDASGNGGSTAFSAATASAGVTVLSVNDAPSGADRTVNVLEDTAYIFTLADFSLDDAGDTPAHALADVRISSLPTAGSLTLSGVAVTAGQFVSAASIAAGNLAFMPVAEASGTGYASFTFQVRDDGGTANGGVDLDPVARTMTVDVTADNDAPSGSSNTVTTLEDTPYTFALADFGFADAVDTPANALAQVRISSLPTAGSLTLSGVAVTSGQFVSAASIAAGNLRFTPVANAHGPAYASFTFQVQDDGGTANGGIDLDPVARTMTLNVTTVNDAPSGSNTTVTTPEDTPYTFALADFGFSDASDAPGNALAGVRIAALPSAGSLRLDGNAVVVGQFVGAADIAAGKLRFSAAANASGAGYAAFTFQVRDDGGTANAGVDLDPVARTLTIDVTAVNDAPAGSDRTVRTLEDTAYTFALVDFGFSDAADAPAHGLASVRIGTLPAAGSLTLSGAALAAGQFVAAADIAAGNLKFVPAANAGGTGYASFTFQVRDDGGTANAGVDLDPVARTMTIDVTTVNDAPAGSSNTVGTPEDTPYVFALADFGFSDAADTPANALAGVRIGSLPAAGTLRLYGSAVVLDQFVSAADIGAGGLVFMPAADASGAGYASFGFRVQDDGGTANGGLNLDPVVRTLRVDVAAVNDAPRLPAPLADATATEDLPFLLALPAGSFVDIDAGDSLSYSASLAGGGALPAWLRFDAPRREFSGTPAGGDVGTITVRVTVRDTGLAAAFGDFVLRVDRGNHAPVLTTPIADQAATEDEPYRFTLPGNSFTDSDPGDSLVLSAALADGSALPAWLRFDAGTRTFSGTPANEQVGSITVRVTATDAASARSFDDFVLTVRNVNDVPTLAQPLGNLAATAELPSSFQVPAATFADPDAGDTLRYSASLSSGAELPGWLRFDAATRTFSGTPSVTDVGQFTVRVLATDSAGASAQSLFVVSVAAPAFSLAESEVAPRPPQAPAAPAQPAPAPVAVAAAATEAQAAPLALESGDSGARAEPVPEAAAAVEAVPVVNVRNDFALEQVSISAVRISSDPVLAPALAPEFGEVARSSTTQMFRDEGLLRKLEEMKRQMQEQGDTQRSLVASTIAVTGGLSIGYVVWLVRGGILVSSMMSALPAWQMIDPLPVLAASRAAQARKGGARTEGDDGEVERLFEDAAASAPESAPVHTAQAPAALDRPEGATP